MEILGHSYEPTDLKLSHENIALPEMFDEITLRVFTYLLIRRLHYNTLRYIKLMCN